MSKLTEVTDLAKLNRGTKYGVTNPPSSPLENDTGRSNG